MSASDTTALTPVFGSLIRRISSARIFSAAGGASRTEAHTTIEVGSHTVLVFVKMQFLGQWSRFNLAQEIAHNVEKTGQLMVVTEDENSAKTTYWYKLDRGHEV